jgi:hypothetical protein
MQRAADLIEHHDLTRQNRPSSVTETLPETPMVVAFHIDLLAI